MQTDGKVVIARSPNTGAWIKSRDTGGTCYTISPDRLEQILMTGKISDAMKGYWKLKPGEFVERFKFDQNGVTVYIGNARSQE